MFLKPLLTVSKIHLMKNASIIISSLALVGVIVLFGMHFSGKKTQDTSVSSTTSKGTVAATGKIAYVDVDSLEAHYEYLKSKKLEFEKKQQAMSAELQRSSNQMQADLENVQRKMKAQTLTEAEYQAAQQRLGQMQQSLETRKQVLTQQLLKEQDDFNTDLKKRLESFLEEYNKDKGYDYILSYTHQGPAMIMYANKSLNITADVIKGMNERSQNAANTTTK